MKDKAFLENLVYSNKYVDKIESVILFSTLFVLLNAKNLPSFIFLATYKADTGVWADNGIRFLTANLSIVVIISLARNSREFWWLM